MAESSQPEKEIIHPSKDIVSTFDEKRDQPWGWIIEFPSQEVIKEYWRKVEQWVKNLENESKHPFSGDCVWIETSPSHPFQNRYYMAFFGWGFSLENLPQWWKNEFGVFPPKVKTYDPSEEQNQEMWAELSEIHRLFFIAEEKVQITKTPLPERKISYEVIKSVPTTLPRFWTSKGLFNIRDSLIPVITQQEFQKKDNHVIHLLEEYILEQMGDWKTVELSSTDYSVVLLPEGFEVDKHEERELKLPDFIRPAYLREPPSWDEEDLDFDYEVDEDHKQDDEIVSSSDEEGSVEE
ncbi:MAG: hypothetical protein ACFFBD_11215 [Candidatus Hodarchaeota archaeon]